MIRALPPLFLLSTAALLSAACSDTTPTPVDLGSAPVDQAITSPDSGSPAPDLGPPARCGDGLTNGDEVCDPTDPATPCCADACDGPADPGTACGADPDAVPCDAAPACDGAGTGAASCLPAAEADGTPCEDDGAFCTGVEECQAGVCTSSGDPCVDDPSDCADRCDEDLNSCTGARVEGWPCTRRCRAGSACDGAGMCVGGTLTCG